jgi:hypothetical protein
MLGNGTVRLLAGVALVLAAAGFVVGAIALFTMKLWWRPVIVAAAAFSAAIFILFWDRQFQALSSKGLFAILINAVILIILLAVKWPGLET